MKNNLLYINGGCFEYELTGVERYTLSVLNEIEKLKSYGYWHDLRIILLVPKSVIFRLSYKYIEIKEVGMLHGAAWEQIELPIYSWNGYLLSLHSRAPLLKRKSLVVLHDAKVAQKENTGAREISRLYHLFMGRFLGKSLSHIITISRFAKQDLIDNFYIDAKKITVILSGVNYLKEIIDASQILQVKKKWPFIDKDYVLAVGGGETKNNILTAKAIEKIGDDNLNFIIAGSVPDNVKKSMQGLKKTNMIGKVSDAELGWLYKNALCLCFPSKVEGFGFPPIEAMASGIPVIASRCQAVPEVCGEAALYVDIDSVDDMVDKILQIRDDEHLRSILINKGYENIKRFNWTKVAQEIMDIVVREMNTYSLINISG